MTFGKAKYKEAIPILADSLQCWLYWKMHVKRKVFYEATL